MSNILILGDTHWGDGSQADNFLWSKLKGEEKVRYCIAIFKRKLKATKEKYKIKKVYGNGDMLEGWMFKIKRIRKVYKSLIKLFDVLITGNHDYQLRGKLFVDIVCDNGIRVHIAHGFTNDKAMKSPITRFLVWCLGGITRLPGLKDLDLFPDILYKNKRSPISIKTERYAENKLEEGYDVVICNHTHEKGAWWLSIDRLDNRLSLPYYNTGSCDGGKFEAAVLNTKTGSVKLIKL